VLASGDVMAGNIISHFLISAKKSKKFVHGQLLQKAFQNIVASLELYKHESLKASLNVGAMSVPSSSIGHPLFVSSHITEGHLSSQSGSQSPSLSFSQESEGVTLIRTVASHVLHSLSVTMSVISYTPGLSYR